MSEDVRGGFDVRGIEPQRNVYDFQVSIDAEFADALEALEVIAAFSRWEELARHVLRDGGRDE